MINKAAKNNADMVILPEMFAYPYEIDKLKEIADKNNETLNVLKTKAHEKKIFLCTGSIAEKEGTSTYNTSYLINPKGEIILKYSKCHLFDVDLPEVQVKESDTFQEGSVLKTVTTELGKIGIIICYDIRFPEMARKLTLEGIDILLVPAAFNTVTGPAHWHITFRTRALENQIFIAAAAPARNNKSAYRAYGHSMFIDPWGRILKQAGTGSSIIYCIIDPEVQHKTRASLPLLKHRRTDLY